MLTVAERIKSIPNKLRKHIKVNGCTLFIQGTHTSCCDLHDIDYAIGIDRLTADRNLKKCIRRVRREQFIKDARHIQKINCWFCRNMRWFLFWMKYKAWKILAVVMYIAVRGFGWYFYGMARHGREGHSGKAWLWPWYSIKSRF